VIGEVECIQQHRGKATGAAPGDGDLREWSPALFAVKIRPTEGVRGGARARREEEIQGEGEEPSVLTVASRFYRRQ
jgi:hypothetical protein